MQQSQKYVFDVHEWSKQKSLEVSSKNIFRARSIFSPKKYQLKIKTFQRKNIIKIIQQTWKTLKNIRLKSFKKHNRKKKRKTQKVWIDKNVKNNTTAKKKKTHTHTNILIKNIHKKKKNEHKINKTK